MTITSHPRAYATVNGLTAKFICLDGRSEVIAASDDDDIRQAVVRRAADEARLAGAVVELVTSGDRGEHRLLIDADGTVLPSQAQLVGAGSPRPASVDLVDTPDLGDQLRDRVRRESPHEPLSAGDSSDRTSFIAPVPSTHPRHAGWRDLVRRMGIIVRPSAAERRRTDLEHIVSRQWAGCRTIAVTNGKGGAGKTITAAMLAAIYARFGGGNVLAWDNNDTRGTLGWRTETGLYDTTIRDLLPAAPELLASTAAVSDISAFVHHQSADRYDVLRSNPELLAAHQRITEADFDMLVQVAARYYRMVVFDSGNDESADRWLRMVDSSDQLVVPTITVPESAETAALLLDALRERDERSRWLADNAVVIVTQSERSSLRELLRIADAFAPRVRAVEVVPYDRALKSGPIRFDALRAATRDAWLRAAAATAASL